MWISISLLALKLITLERKKLSNKISKRKYKAMFHNVNEGYSKTQNSEAI